MSSVAGQGPVARLVDQPDRAGMARLRLALTLPRVATTLPTVRALLDAALTLLGTAEDCRCELAVALTEACANAILHAEGSDGYTVGVTLSGDTCVIEVADTGVGMDPEGPGGDPPDRRSDRGRGLPLIRRLTDSVELRPVQPHGLAVRMCKELRYAG